jgi:hypothetical protein
MEGKAMSSLRDTDERERTKSNGRHVPFGLRPMAAIARLLRGSAGSVGMCSVLLTSRRMRRSMTGLGRLCP